MLIVLHRELWQRLNLASEQVTLRFGCRAVDAPRLMTARELNNLSQLWQGEVPITRCFWVSKGDPIELYVVGVSQQAATNGVPHDVGCVRHRLKQEPLPAIPTCRADERNASSSEATGDLYLSVVPQTAQSVLVALYGVSYTLSTTIRELRECCSMCQELRSTTRTLGQQCTLLASNAERL